MATDLPPEEASDQSAAGSKRVLAAVFVSVALVGAFVWLLLRNPGQNLHIRVDRPELASAMSPATKPGPIGNASPGTLDIVGGDKSADDASRALNRISGPDQAFREEQEKLRLAFLAAGDPPPATVPATVVAKEEAPASAPARERKRKTEDGDPPIGDREPTMAFAQRISDLRLGVAFDKRARPHAGGKSIDGLDERDIAMLEKFCRLDASNVHPSLVRYLATEIVLTRDFYERRVQAAQRAFETVVAAVLIDVTSAEHQLLPAPNDGERLADQQSASARTWRNAIDDLRSSVRRSPDPRKLRADLAALWTGTEAELARSFDTDFATKIHEISARHRDPHYIHANFPAWARRNAKARTHYFPVEFVAFGDRIKTVGYISSNVPSSYHVFELDESSEVRLLLRRYNAGNSGLMTGFVGGPPAGGHAMTIDTFREIDGALQRVDFDLGEPIRGPTSGDPGTVDGFTAVELKASAIPLTASLDAGRYIVEARLEESVANPSQEFSIELEIRPKNR